MSRRAELFRALGSLCETPHPAQANIALALGLQGPADPSEHTDAFVFQMPPYASIYLGPEGMLGGDARARIAGFWRAVGFAPPPEPDHLAALLSLYAVLDEAEDCENEPARRILRGEAKRALLWEHLLPWVPFYASKMMLQMAPGNWAHWSNLLSQVVMAETELLQGPRELPVHLRSAPPPEEAGAGRDELIDALLSPVRSGLLLTRHDLAGVASDCNLGLRMGERRFALRTMLDQDPIAVLGWLACFARTWAMRHRELVGDIGPIAAFWADRAEATADSMAETLAVSGPLARPP